jgi:hypothetical protein
MKRPTLVQVVGPNTVKVIQAHNLPLNLRRIISVPATFSFPKPVGSKIRDGKALSIGKQKYAFHIIFVFLSFFHK